MMGKEKPVVFYHRLFVFLAVISCGLLLQKFLLRDHWFDEALTLINFALLGSPGEIYRSYVIPNNQIVNTVFLHYLWKRLEVPPGLLRLFPLFCGVLMIFLLRAKVRGEKKIAALDCALFALVLSPAFLIYSTALRGYILVMLFGVAALLCGKKYLLTSRKLHLAGWFVFSLAALGTMPSALAVLAGSGCYLAVYCRKKFYSDKRLYILALLTLTAFALFYLPIWKNLSGAFALKEGWHDHTAALLATYTGFCYTFLPLIFFSIYSLVKYPLPKKYLIWSLIWLMPLGMFIFPVAPFPRVWVVLLPLMALTLSRVLGRLPRKILPFVMASVLLWGWLGNMVPVKKYFSLWCSGAGQDDFIYPEFVRKEYAPSATAELIRKKYPHSPVFVSFNADPWAMMLTLNRPVFFDSPRGKVRKLPPGCMVILHKNESATDYSKRFQLPLFKLEKCGIHNIYTSKQRVQ